jgi:glycerol-3-phosphate acyltransferase PlsY
VLIRDAALVGIAYLLGSVPFGLLVARLQGNVDLRRVGSGNIGATNVLRAVGKGAAAVTLLGDIGKGAAAVAMARGLGASSGVVAAVALGAVLGHLFPLFLGFRGGKGVATTLGVVLAAMPAVGGLLLVVWLLVATVWRYSSLAALAAAASLPGLVWLLDGRGAMLLLGGVLTLLLFWRHRENIQRLLRGTEGKIGQKLRPADSGGH